MVDKRSLENTEEMYGLRCSEGGVLSVCLGIMTYMQEACALYEITGPDWNDLRLIRSNESFDQFFCDWNTDRHIIGEDCFKAMCVSGGTVRWSLTNGKKVGEGNLIQLTDEQCMLIFTDVTRQRDMEILKVGYRRLIEESQDIVLFIASDGRIMDANAQAVSTYGYTYEELTSMTVKGLRSDETNTVFSEQFKTALDKGIVFETVHKCKDGRLFPVEVSSKSSTVYDEPIVMSLVRDITHRKKEQEVLLELITHDALTGALNRAGLQDEFDKCCLSLHARTPFAVFHMDINLFKSINDTYGHAAGDEILKEFVRRLKSQIRSEDLVVRLGGDEFLLVLNSLCESNHIMEVTSFAQRLIRVMEPIHVHEGRDIPIKASIGISLYPKDGSTLEELISAADRAMYTVKAKSNETHYCIFDQ